MEQAKEVSFGSVMQRMHKEKRTGILDVSGSDGDWEVHLHQGNVGDVRSSMHSAWTLGEALVSRGIVTARRLSKLDSWARKRGLHVEDVLVSRGEISEELVERIQTLHLRETILPLFRRVGIFCHFRHEAPSFLVGSRKVATAELLREASRRLQLWPGLEKRIPSVQAVYRKEVGAIPVAYGDLGSDTAEKDGGAVEGKTGSKERLTANMRLIFYELNGVRTVRQLAIVTGLGEFEAVMGLSKLMEYGLIRLVQLDGKGERPLEISYIPLLANALSTVLLVALVAWVAFSWSPEIWFNDPSIHQSQITPSILQYREGIVRQGVERVAVEKGLFPSSLEDLVLDGWVTAEELGPYPNGERMDYRASRLKDRYSLRLLPSPHLLEDVSKTNDKGEAAPAGEVD